MIFLFQRFITHYRIPVFNKLNIRLNDELIVCHGKPLKNLNFSINNNQISFKNFELKNYWLGKPKGDGSTGLWQNFMRVFFHYGKPKIVIVEFSLRILYVLPLLYYCKVKNIPFILWGHAGSRSRDIVKSLLLKDKLYRWTARKSSAFIVYSNEDAKRLSGFIPIEKVFIAQNTLDVNHLFELRKILNKQGKRKIKEKLNLRENIYICFIGRLTENKMLDKLIRIFSSVKIKTPKLGLIIIGDGEKRVVLEELIHKEKIEDVLFTGAINDWEKSAEFLYCSDVMVIPGAVGLSVNHSLSFGIPVVTTKQSANGPYHGPEIEYIIDGETGFKCGKEDEEMIEAIEIVISNKKDFYNQSVKFSEKKLVLDNMINGIIKAINYV